MALTKEYKNRINEMFMEFYETRDTEKFGELYVALRPYLYNLIRSKFNKEKDAIEAIMSTSFMHMFERINSFNPKYKPWNWIQTIVVNNAIQHYYGVRDGHKHKEIDTVYDLAIPENEDYEYLYLAIEKLADKERYIIDMILAGWKTKEIADKLGIENRYEFYGPLNKAYRELFNILNKERGMEVPDKFKPRAPYKSKEHREAIKAGMARRKALGIRNKNLGKKYGPRKPK